MRKWTRRLWALALCLCLASGSAQAGIAGLDEVFSSYFDVNDDVSMSIGLEVKTLLPYGEETVAMLNGALRHLQMSATVGDVTAMSLLSDGEAVLSLNQRQENGLSVLTTPLLPNRTLTSSGSALDALFAGEEEEPAFDLLTAIFQAEDCYQALTDAIAPYAEEKKANYKIAGIGYAKWVRLARLDPEQSAALLPQLTALLGCGMDEDFREQLKSMTCKKNFTIALYRTEENGADLSVYIKGNVSMGENDNRTLDYKWAFSRAEGKSKDDYKLELIRSKAPVDRRLIEASVTRGGASQKPELTLNSSVTLRNPQGTFITTEKHSLKGAESGGKTTLSGKLSTTVKTTVDGSTQTLVSEMEPELTLTSAEGSGVLSGSVKLTEKAGKNKTRELTLLMSEAPANALSAAAADGTLYAVSEGGDEVTITIGGGSLAQNADALTEGATPGQNGDFLVGKPPLGMKTYSAPSEMQTVDLDAADESRKAALREELAGNAAGLLLIALSKLPEEDRGLLSDNMTDEDFAALLKLTEGL